MYPGCSVYRKKAFLVQTFELMCGAVSDILLFQFVKAHDRVTEKVQPQNLHENFAKPINQA